MEVVILFKTELEVSMLKEQIGQAAGEIYGYLESNKGTASLAQLKKKLDLKNNLLEFGLGWLAREDKISVVNKAASVSITLN